MPGAQAALGGGLFLQRLLGGDGGEAAPPVTPKGAGPVDRTGPPGGAGQAAAMSHPFPWPQVQTFPSWVQFLLPRTVRVD